MILVAEDRLEERLIHPRRGRQPMKQEDHRRVFRPGLPIENIQVIDTHRVIGDRLPAKCVCDVQSKKGCAESEPGCCHSTSKMVSTIRGAPIGILWTPYTTRTCPACGPKICTNRLEAPSPTVACSANCSVVHIRTVNFASF